MFVTALPAIAAFLALPKPRTPAVTPCLLCGTAVAPNARYPFRFAGIDVQYCGPCDEHESTDRKLLGIARALDGRLHVAATE